MTSFLFLLAGCPYLSAEDYASIRDLDNDGVEAIRFGGRDCDDNDPSFADCDADRDGFRSLAGGGDDCDDTAVTVFPGAVERCDGIDNDCDGRIDDDDDDVQNAPLAWRDADRDGFGAGEAFPSCATSATVARRDGDCDDTLDSVNPALEELCDGVDRNCDGDPLLGATREWFADEDGDGFGSDVVIATTCAPPDSVVVTNSNDCDDTNANAHPTDVELADPTEICDGIDNDCDGLFDADDDDFSDPLQVTRFRDEDGDGFGDIDHPDERCEGDPGWVVNAFDCDDHDPLGRPGAAPTFRSDEICDGFDNDCNGLIDAADPGIDATTVFAGWPDDDGDGFGDEDAGPTVFCTLPDDYSMVPTDCDDDDPNNYPTNQESCADASDNDCDGLVNSEDPDNDGAFIWYRDADLDGAGLSDQQGASCGEFAGGPTGYSPNDGDCNDANGEITAPVPWFWDADGDDFGDPFPTTPPFDNLGDFVFSCFAPAFRVANDDDCDDSNVAVSPNAQELCNGLDDDCDGSIDENAPGAVFGWPDLDGDGYGNDRHDGQTVPGRFLCVFDSPVATVRGDCDDDDALVNPLARERCGEDRDCDGRLGDDTVADVIPIDWYPDLDFDGFGNGGAPPVQQCAPPPRHVRDNTDCDDHDPSLYFSEYVLDPSVDFRFTLSSLQRILDHPARCPAGPTTITLASDVVQLDSVLIHDTTNGLTIDGDGHQICWASDESLRIQDGAVTVREVDWIHADPTTGGCDLDTDSSDDRAVFLVGSPAESSLTLEDFSFVGPSLGAPLVRHQPDGPNESVDLTLTRVDLTDVALTGPLLQTANAAYSITVFDSRFDGLTMTPTPSPFIDLVDFAGATGQISIEGSSFVDVGLSGPLVRTNGPVNVDFTTNRLDDVRVEDGVLLCMNGAGCTSADETTLDVTPAGSVFLDGNHITDLTDGLGASATLAWVPNAFTVDSFRNTLEGSSNTGAPLVRSVGIAPDQGQGVNSTQDRFIGMTGGLSADNGTLVLTESRIITSTFPVTSTHGLIDMNNAVVMDSLVSRQAEEIRGRHNLYLDSSWSSTTGTAEYGPDYVFTGTTRGPDCTDGLGVDNARCLELNPDSQPLVTYHPSLPYDRMIPVPRNNDGFADSPFVYAGVRWDLDPNDDGLPVAWLVFHANTPECQSVGDALFDGDGDPDGDHLTNAQEWLAGTWPCVANTDRDPVGFGDAVDPHPLNPGLNLP